MAGCAADLLYQEQDRVGVAVKAYGLNLLDIARGAALVPEFLPAAAPVMSFARAESCIPGVFIHIGEHQDFPGGGILRNGGNKTFGEIGSKARRRQGSVRHGVLRQEKFLVIVIVRPSVRDVNALAA